MTDDVQRDDATCGSATRVNAWPTSDTSPWTCPSTRRRSRRCTPTPRRCATRQLGDRAEFFEHYGYIIREPARITKPGRICPCTSNSSPPPSDARRDRHDRLPRAGHRRLHGCRLGVPRRGDCPSGTRRPRRSAPKPKPSMFVTKNRDSSMTRPARRPRRCSAPGDNAVPIKNDVTNEEWIEWARPVVGHQRDKHVERARRAGRGRRAAHLPAATRL